jgi:hypothetical protein
MRRLYVAEQYISQDRHDVVIYGVIVIGFCAFAQPGDAIFCPACDIFGQPCGIVKNQAGRRLLVKFLNLIADFLFGFSSNISVFLMVLSPPLTAFFPVHFWPCSHHITRFILRPAPLPLLFFALKPLPFRCFFAKIPRRFAKKPLK